MSTAGLKFISKAELVLDDEDNSVEGLLFASICLTVMLQPFSSFSDIFRSNCERKMMEKSNVCLLYTSRCV